MVILFDENLQTCSNIPGQDTHQCYPVTQATDCWINKDQSGIVDILILVEDAPACFWKHRETKAVAVVLFPEENNMSQS